MPVHAEGPQKLDVAATFGWLPGERREGPVVAVGVLHGEVTGRVVRLVHDRMHHRRANHPYPLQHRVGIRSHDMKRARPRPARSNPLARAGEQHPTPLRPVQLAVMDQPAPLARIIRSSVNPSASNQSRNANASSLTTLAQMLG